MLHICDPLRLSDVRAHNQAYGVYIALTWDGDAACYFLQKEHSRTLSKRVFDRLSLPSTTMH